MKLGKDLHSNFIRVPIYYIYYICYIYYIYYIYYICYMFRERKQRDSK